MLHGTDKSKGKAAMPAHLNWFCASILPGPSMLPTFNSFGELAKALLTPRADLELVPDLSRSWADATLSRFSGGERPSLDLNSEPAPLNPLTPPPLHLSLGVTPALLEIENPTPELQCNLAPITLGSPATTNLDLKRPWRMHVLIQDLSS